MTTKEGIRIVEMCIQAEIKRGKSRPEATDAVSKEIQRFMEDGTDPVLGMNVLKSVFLGESPRDLANSMITELLK